MKQDNLLTKTIFEACQDKKGIEPVFMDLADQQSYAEHVIIVGGSSDRQVQAIADNVLDMAHKNANLSPLGVEGYESGLWVLIDFGYVVCHVFQNEARYVYHLEDMWPKVKVLDEQTATTFFKGVKQAKAKVKATAKTKATATAKVKVKATTKVKVKTKAPRRRKAN